MTRCFETLNLNKTSAAKLTCLFTRSRHTTPDLDLATQHCHMLGFICYFTSDWLECVEGVTGHC